MVEVAVIDPWRRWVSGNTTVTTGTAFYWPFDNATASASTGFITLRNLTWNTWVETEVETAARLDRQQAAREEASARRLAAETRMVGAQDRAMDLLLSILTAEERVWYDTHDEIAVRGSDGGLFVIEKRSVHGNIREVDEHGCLLGRVCVAPRMYDQEGGALPLADGWVGQYLAIKHQEAALRATGNWSHRGACRHPGVPILMAA